MARAPFQVLVLPFRFAEGSEAEFAILRRADVGRWQGIAGGGEDDETILEAARREASEEAGIPTGARFHELKMQDFVPVTCFKAAAESPRDTYLVPQYFFACDVTGLVLTLSGEHTHIGWLSYEQAHKRLRYDGNKVALWELFERLRAGDPPLAQERRLQGARTAGKGPFPANSTTHRASARARSPRADGVAMTSRPCSVRSARAHR